MILQALYRYHQILLETEGDKIPGEAYSSADAAYELHLGADGTIDGIVSYVDGKGKAEKRSYLVPKQKGRSGSGVNPYFLCEKAEYLFGDAVGGKAAYRQGLVALWRSVLDQTETEASPEAQSLLTFCSLAEEELARQVNRNIDDKLRETLQKSGGLFVLKYVPTGRFLHDVPAIRKAWELYFAGLQGEDDTGSGQMCLITGEYVPANRIARLHPSIKNVVGAQSSGASLVSFNIDSFRSFGRDQSYNAPTSQRAAEAYGYVLNKLLADPNHRTRMNDMTVVFWAESASDPEQKFLASFLVDSSDEQDAGPDADDLRKRVKASMERIRQGQTFRETFDDLKNDTTFYLLGLSPNAARLSVRMWYTGTIGEMGEQVWNHYRDLSVVGLDRSPTVRQLLREIAVGHDGKNMPPLMEGQLLRCILLGLPYPRAYYAQLMNRIRAESDDPRIGLYKIGALRAGMIKAYLLRCARKNHDTTMEGALTMALNEQSTSAPYNLGRLFACLELAQSSALGRGLNATIRDRYWGAASTTPATVFPRLLHLAQHHISKDEKHGHASNYRIQKVMNALPERLPNRLTLEEQGMFALGYYHQRESIFNGSNNANNTQDQETGDIQ